MEDLFCVKGKVALVTGGSRGIGAMVAQGFVEAGVKTFISSRKADELEATASALCASGECIAVPADISTMEGVQSLAQSVHSYGEKLDILVNNAGASLGRHARRLPGKWLGQSYEPERQITIFLVAGNSSRSCATAPTDDDPARVINISSINAYIIDKLNNYSYSASKAAINHLTSHLANDLAADNINVNAIAPGLFLTKMVAGAVSGKQTRNHSENSSWSCRSCGGRRGNSDLPFLSSFCLGHWTDDRSRRWACVKRILNKNKAFEILNVLVAGHAVALVFRASTALSFGYDCGAVGYLVGEENNGLTYMFHMMNRHGSW